MAKMILFTLHSATIKTRTAEEQNKLYQQFTLHSATIKTR